MKRALYYFFFILFLFLVQTAMQKVFFASAFVPQLLLLAVIVAAATSDYRQALILAFGSGLLAEFASSISFGSFISAFVVAALLSHLLTRKLTSQDISFGTALLLVFGSTLFFAIWVYVFNLFTSGLSLGPEVLARDVFRWRLLLTGLVNLLCFFPLLRLYRIFFHE